MKILQNYQWPIFEIIFSIVFGINQNLIAEASLTETHWLSSKPLYEVISLGASTSGSLVEGSVGSIQKGSRHRFYCHSNSPTIGFLGSKKVAKPVILRNQPGVFPAPLMGENSLTFRFSCQDNGAHVIPVVVRPDGTVFKGLPMTFVNSPQTLIISSPAQTGIYTVFALAQQKDSLGACMTVDVSISTQPQNNTTFHLKSFEPTEKDADLISHEFVYHPSG